MNIHSFHRSAPYQSFNQSFICQNVCLNEQSLGNNIKKFYFEVPAYVW
jgi:hypothetical protein